MRSENSRWKVFCNILVTYRDQDIFFSFLSLSSSLINLLIGTVSTFVAASNGIKTPSGIAMNNKLNCFFVANYSAHTIVKITASGMLRTLFLFPPVHCSFYFYLFFVVYKR